MKQEELVVPEIHTGRAHENTPAPAEETKPAEEPITYDNVAIPEIHLKRKRKPRYNVKRAWTMLKNIVQAHFCMKKECDRLCGQTIKKTSKHTF